MTYLKIVNCACICFRNIQVTNAGSHLNTRRTATPAAICTHSCSITIDTHRNNSLETVMVVSLCVCVVGEGDAYRKSSERAPWGTYLALWQANAAFQCIE